MKSHLGTRSWLVVALIAGALLSGPTAVAAVWLIAATGFVVVPDAAPRFSGPQGREADFTELLATRDQTGGSLGMFRQTIAPKSGPPTHIHQTEDEFFYVVSGEFKVKVGDRIMSAPAQSVMFVPRGTAHTFQNVGAEPGVLLGRVNTSSHSYGIMHGWNSTKRSISRSSTVCPDNGAMSAIRICSFSMRSCTWPSMVASGA